MLTQVKIAGFKAIYDSGPVSLQPLTLFIGRNGSGKSSLIEALQWLQESLASNLETATSNRFGDFDELCNRRTDRTQLELKYEKGSREVRYQLLVRRGSGRRQEPSIEDESCREGRTSAARWTIQTLREGRTDPVRQVGQTRVDNPLVLGLASINRRDAPQSYIFANYIADAVFLRLSPTAIAEAVRLRRPSHGPALDETGRRLAALLQSLTDEQRQQVGLELAQIIPGIKRVDIVGTEDMGTFGAQEKMRSRGGTRTHLIPARLLSEGTRRLAAIFALLAIEPSPPLIAIEEIENGLDPWTLRYVFKRLQEAAEAGTQILLTTHSPFLLDHVEPAQVIHVTRDKGDTSYTPIESYQLVAEHAGLVAPGAMYLREYLTGPRRPADDHDE